MVNSTKKVPLQNKIKHAILDALPDKTYLKLIYKKRTGKKLNLNNPVGFNEKLQWLKLNDRNPSYKIYADKYYVRNFVKKTIGGKYLNELYGVYDNAKEIDWDKLPNQFVMRCTHGSNFNILCDDKDKLDINTAAKNLDAWMNTDYFRHAREWQYKNIAPKIVCEKFLQEDIVDYKFYCFNGVPKFFNVACGNKIKDGCRYLKFFNMDWSPSPFYRSDYAVIKKEIIRPDNFDEMVEIVKKLSRGIPFVRIDLFNVDGTIFFSEMTFHPVSGCSLFCPEEYEIEIGSYLDLSSVNTDKRK